MYGRAARTLAVAVIATLASISRSSAQQWLVGPTTTTSHYIGTSILLQNGKVLMMGGGNEKGIGKECELYDPLTNTITPTAPMAHERYWFSSVMLRDGRVMAIGGLDNTDRTRAECEIYDPVTETWSLTGNLHVARGRGTATLLNDGRVFVTGGISYGSTIPGCEIYDPAAGTWSSTPSMQTERNSHAAVLLQDGTVLVVSGYPYKLSSEVYDPVRNTWTLKGNIVKLFPTGEHSLTLLRDGRALLAGGWGGGLGMTNRCELYDPTTGTWSETDPLDTPRCGQRMVLLPDGRVMAIGGHNSTANDDQSCYSIRPCEIFDPTTDTWSRGPEIPVPITYFVATLLPNGKIFISGGGLRRNSLSPEKFYKLSYVVDLSRSTVTPTATMPSGGYMPTATLLPNGRLLMTGGSDDCQTTGSDRSMLYDPATRSWTSAGTMANRRSAHTASLLLDGTVLVTGGMNNGAATATTERYDPVTGSWSMAAPLATHRALHSATQSVAGTILVTGGASSVGTGGATGITNSTELYDASADRWTTGGPLLAARYAHTATLLPDGRILVTGGLGPAPLASCELYDPHCDLWTPAASMQSARAFHSATLLTDGTVLVAGGEADTRKLASCEIYDYRTNSWRSAGSLPAARSRHTATLIPSGDVVVAGGLDDRGFSLSDVADFSMIDRQWRPGTSLSSPRSSHAAALLPDGTLLLAGGVSRAIDCRLPLVPDIYLPAPAVNDVNRPLISSLSNTQLHITGTGDAELDIRGSGFRDDRNRPTNEASTGDCASSPTNYPVVTLRRIGGDRYDNDFTAHLPFNVGKGGWSSSETHVRIPVGTPGNRPLPAGWYALTVTANAVSSLPAYINILYSDEATIPGPRVVGTDGNCINRIYDLATPCMLQTIELDSAASSNIRIEVAGPVPATSARLTIRLIDPSRAGHAVIRVNGQTLIDDTLTTDGFGIIDSLTIAAAWTQQCDTVTVTNRTDAPLTIPSARLLHGGGFALGTRRFPMEIPPHGSASIPVCYTPGSAAEEFDTLVIASPCFDHLVSLMALTDATVEGIADCNTHVTVRMLPIDKILVQAYPPVIDGSTITLRVDQYAPSAQDFVELQGSVYSSRGNFIAEAGYVGGALTSVGKDVVREGMLRVDAREWPQGTYIIVVRTNNGTIGYPLNIVR